MLSFSLVLDLFANYYITMRLTFPWSLSLACGNQTVGSGSDITFYMYYSCHNVIEMYSLCFQACQILYWGVVPLTHARTYPCNQTRDP